MVIVYIHTTMSTDLIQTKAIKVNGENIKVKMHLHPVQLIRLSQLHKGVVNYGYSVVNSQVILPSTISVIFGLLTFNQRNGRELIQKLDLPHVLDIV